MKNRKRLCLVLALVMIISSVFSVSTAEVEAAVTAKSLVKSALKYMKSYDSISYTYDSTYDRDGTIKTRTGMVTSDTKIDHGFYMDKTQSEGGWEEYEKKDKTYRKGYSSSEWKIYTDTDYDSKSVASYPSKKYIQYILGHLKSINS